MLLNPKTASWQGLDPFSRSLMAKTVGFFETKGQARMKDDDANRVWYADFLGFVKEQKAFSSLLTPPEYGDENCRWDTWRNCAFNEILGFYGLAYWYTWQVSILGLGPIWMSRNETLKKRAAQFLREGEIFAFGLSERAHGADVYSTDMILRPNGQGQYLASGGKYYIGNANAAKMVSTFGKLDGSFEYVIFNCNHLSDRFTLVKNVCNSQSYVAEFNLQDYPIAEEEILHQGQEAWDAALNTVNVGKYNLGWASIGMCTHALYEAINHAANRRLYRMAVTDFPHVKQLFTDAYARLVAMKLFALRAADYQRVASPQDRRYLLYNPVVKMKVTTQGEEVMNLLWDVIAAKGFEKETYFEMMARDIRALPKLEGTVHVNIALIVKFMFNYFTNPQEFPEVGPQTQPAHDAYLFNQGPTKGLGHVVFHDGEAVYRESTVPNVKIFLEQIDVFKEFLMLATPSDQQRKDIDFLLSLGEIFTLVVYGQLILENAPIYHIEDALVDQIFDFMVRDFSKFALGLYSKPTANAQQMDYCLKMIRKPSVDEGRYQHIWEDCVFALKDTYEMSR